MVLLLLSAVILIARSKDRFYVVKICEKKLILCTLCVQYIPFTPFIYISAFCPSVFFRYSHGSQGNDLAAPRGWPVGARCAPSPATAHTGSRVHVVSARQKVTALDPRCGTSRLPATTVARLPVFTDVTCFSVGEPHHSSVRTMDLAPWTRPVASLRYIISFIYPYFTGLP